MIDKTHLEKSLQLLGYCKDAGYKKGWYRIVYPKDCTPKDFEKHSLGVLFCGTDPIEILNEELKELFL